MGFQPLVLSPRRRWDGPGKSWNHQYENRRGTMESSAVKVCYLDASALVKLVADDRDEEPGRDAVREYYHTNANMKATPYCVAETLSVFKRKFLVKKISRDEYKRYVKAFVHTIIGANLTIEEPQSSEWVGFGSSILPTLKLLSEAETLLDKYEIDFIDCVQIANILHGKFSPLSGDSRSILITADRDLAQAARAETARVWECTSEPPPP